MSADRFDEMAREFFSAAQPSVEKLKLIEATDPETMAASAMYGHRRSGTTIEEAKKAIDGLRYANDYDEPYKDGFNDCLTSALKVLGRVLGP